MKVMAAGKAKNGFGLLIDTARVEPVMIEKHGRPVTVVMSVEEYERLKGLEAEDRPIQHITRRLGAEARELKLERATRQTKTG